MAKSKVIRKSHHDYTESFYSDLVFPEMYYAALLRHKESALPVQSIEISDSIKNDIKFFSNNDCPGNKTVNFLNTEIKIFADEEASYIGECAGIICAENIEKLLQSKDEIQINYKK